MLAPIPLILVALLSILVFLLRPTNELAFPLFALVTAVVMDRILSAGHQAERKEPATQSSSQDIDPKGVIASIQLWIGRHLAFLGIVSFSFYLLHQPILVLVSSRLHRLT